MNEKDLLADGEYDALVLRIAEQMHAERPDWTLDNCMGMVRTGIKRGVSREGAEVFEQTFRDAFELLRAESRPRPEGADL